MREIPYRTVDGRRLNLHVSPASGGPAPPAVFFHGGGWTRGSWRQFEPQAERLAGLGMATVLVEYRLDGPVAAVEDAFDSLHALAGRADEIGADLRRLVTVGGSAGGLLALAPAVLQPPHGGAAVKPAAVVLLNPVTDTTGDFPDGFGRRLFGSTEEAARYSPRRHVSSQLPPTLIMHGTGDTAVHHANSVAFADEATRCGASVELISYPGEPHGFFNPVSTGMNRPDTDGDANFERTTRDLITFLRRAALVS